MYCMSCGSEVVQGSRFCIQCGADQPDPANVEMTAQAPPENPVPRAEHPADPPLAKAPPVDPSWRPARMPVTPPPLTSPTGRPKSVQFSAARWDRGDRFVVGGTAALLLTLFLPWFSASFDGVSLAGVPGLSIDALDAHGWMYATLITGIALIAYLVARATGVELNLPRPHREVLAAGAGLLLLLTLIGFIAAPADTSLDYGAYVGLLAALSAAAGAAIHWRDVDSTAATGAQPSAAGRSAATPAGWRTGASRPAAASAPVMPAFTAHVPSASQSATATCPSCGRDNLPGRSFCGACGVNLSGSAAAEGTA